MECIIQVFNDSLHLQTLGIFIEGCGSLQPKVNVKNIITSLIDRLADFSLENKDEVEAAEIPLFEIFSEQITNVVAARPEMPIEDVVALQVSGLSWSLHA
jgi:vacuolar protein sorting-associated protein 35